MATRQNSTNGKPKSPRIQVVIPELICEKLTILAQNESRTVSNMAKVLIQRGIKNYLEKKGKTLIGNLYPDTDSFRNSLENQSVKRLKGPPKRIKFMNNQEKK